MARFTDKDSFKLIYYKETCDIHAIRPGISNDSKQYGNCSGAVPITTNGEAITLWSSGNYISTQPINRAYLAEMIRESKPEDGLPIFVVAIPDIERTDIGMITYCWMRRITPETMQLYDSPAKFSVLDPAAGFHTSNVMLETGKLRVYYDWREALPLIENYFKAVIKYCKDIGKAYRLKIESENQALEDLDKDVRALVAKNNKRFKNIEF